MVVPIKQAVQRGRERHWHCLYPFLYYLSCYNEHELFTHFLIKKKKSAWHREAPNKVIVMSESKVRVSIWPNRDLSALEAWVWREEKRVIARGEFVLEVFTFQWERSAHPKLKDWNRREGEWIGLGKMGINQWSKVLSNWQGQKGNSPRTLNELVIFGEGNSDWIVNR